MRIHQYSRRLVWRVNAGEMGTLEVPYSVCDCCGQTMGLDWWQLESMSVSMARCPKGKEIGWWRSLLVWIGLADLNCTVVEPAKEATG